VSGYAVAWKRACVWLVFVSAGRWSSVAATSGAGIGGQPCIALATGRFSTPAARPRRGFSPVLCQLKQRLSHTYPSLPKENPGSRWPKTSLAALKDNQRLTPDQLERLVAICK
jgi:hypothetical protein